MDGTGKRSRDSILDIWGSRTPYFGQWPARIDQNLLEEPDRWVQSACMLCSNGCAMDIGVKDGRMVGVRGRAVDHVNKGRLGPKGLNGWMANSSPDRLKRPLIRRGSSLQEASWDEAMSLIVSRTQELTRRYSANTLGFYHTGQLFLEEFYTLALIVFGGLGTNNLDANTRLCTATAESALRESFGTDGQPGSYSDIDTTDMLFHIGHNVASQQTVLWTRILDRLHGANPPRLIVVDPRRTDTAGEAHLHIALRVGTNLAFMNGLLHLLIRNGHVDHEYVNAHTLGFDALAQTTANYPPKRVAQICDIPAAQLEQAAEMVGTAPRLVSTVLQGVYQSPYATASAVQVNNLHLIRGMIGKPGCTVFQMNGQPSAQNSRETGASSTYPGMRNWQNPAQVAEIARLWNVEPKSIPSYTEPTPAMEILRRAETGSIRSLWITGTNPAVSMPDLPRMRRIFSKPGLFLIVQDAFLSETAEFADVVLPAAMWGEKTGTYTNTERTVHISYKAVEPPGEARSDFDIFLDFARRMNLRDKDGAPLVKWSTPEQAFDAWRAMSAGRPCDYSGLSYAKLTGGSGVRWPCNEHFPQGTERLYTDGVFNTASDYCQTYGHTLVDGGEIAESAYRAENPAGRALIKAAEYQPPPETPDSEYPLIATTGRVVYHWHTRTKTGRVPPLQDAAPDAFVQISEGDAAAQSIHEGDWVELRTRRGSILVRARIGRIRPGHVFVPFHYGYWDHWNRKRAANEFTLSQWDPVSKQPYLKSSTARLIKVDARSLADGQTASVSDRLMGVQKPAYEEKPVTDSAKLPHPEQQIPVYLALVQRGEQALAEAYDTVAQHHAANDELRTRCKETAERSRAGATGLHALIDQYGPAEEAEPEQLRGAMFGGSREGNLGQLRDLHDLYTLTSYLSIGFFALKQAGSALKDAALTAAASARMDELTMEEGWLDREIRAIAAQALVVPAPA